jgi:ribonuclease HI
VDGSSWVIKGKRHNEYSVIDGTHLTIIESGQLHNNWSDQTCKLFAFNQALKLLEKREGTIYTDSKYVSGTVHMFQKIWIEQDLVNSKGKNIVHKECSTQVLENLKK